MTGQQYANSPSKPGTVTSSTDWVWTTGFRSYDRERREHGPTYLLFSTSFCSFSTASSMAPTMSKASLNR